MHVRWYSPYHIPAVCEFIAQEVNSHQCTTVRPPWASISKCSERRWKLTHWGHKIMGPSYGKGSMERGNSWRFNLLCSTLYKRRKIRTQPWRETGSPNKGKQDHLTTFNPPTAQAPRATSKAALGSIPNCPCFSHDITGSKGCWGACIMPWVAQWMCSQRSTMEREGERQTDRSTKKK